MAEQTHEQRAVWLQKQLDEARKSSTETYQKHSEQIERLRTDLDRANDRARSESARADLAEEAEHG